MAPHILIRPSFVDLDDCCLCHRFGTVYSGSDGHRYCLHCRNELVSGGVASLGGDHTTQRHSPCQFFFDAEELYRRTVGAFVIDNDNGQVVEFDSGSTSSEAFSNPDLAWTQRAPTAQEVEDRLNEKLRDRWRSK